MVLQKRLDSGGAFPVTVAHLSQGFGENEETQELVADIRIQEGESLESALRRFKRKVQSEDIIKEIRKHSYFLKPGEKKRIKQALARKRARKKMRREAS